MTQEPECHFLQNQAPATRRFAYPKHLPLVASSSISIYGAPTSSLADETPPIHILTKAKSGFTEAALNPRQLAYEIGLFRTRDGNMSYGFYAGLPKANFDPDEFELLSVSMMVLTVRTGQSRDDLRRTFADHELCAVIHPTGARPFELTLIDVDQVADIVDVELYDDISAADVRQALRDAYGYHDSVLQTCEYLGIAEDGLDRMCVIRHRPITEYKVYLPFKRPFSTQLIPEGPIRKDCFWSDLCFKVARILRIGGTLSRYTETDEIHYWRNADNMEEGDVDLVIGNLLDWGEIPQSLYSGSGPLGFGQAMETV